MFEAHFFTLGDVGFLIKDLLGHADGNGVGGVMVAGEGARVDGWGKGRDGCEAEAE